MKNKIKFISEISMFISLTVVITILLIIPLPNGSGYLNLSDALIMLGSIVTTPIGGLLIGSISGAIADLASGYSMYVPFTIIIKGLEGFLSGYLFIQIKNQKLKYSSLYISGLLMGILYIIPDLLYYGTSAAIYNLPFNILQGMFNALITTIVVSIYFKSKQKTLSSK